jgi:hypothetical protein
MQGVKLVLSIDLGPFNFSANFKKWAVLSQDFLLKKLVLLTDLGPFYFSAIF